MTLGRNGLIPTTRDLAGMTPAEFVRAISDDGDFPAAVMLCGHGRHIGGSLDAVKALCGGRVPDPITVLGGVSTIARSLREQGDQALAVYVDQLRFSVEDHGAKLLFILLHQFCGGAREEVLTRIPDAAPFYDGSLHPADNPDLFVQHQIVETEVQREHLEHTLQWLKRVLPDLPVEVYRITDGRLDRFGGYIDALMKVREGRSAA